MSILRVTLLAALFMIFSTISYGQVCDIRQIPDSQNFASQDDQFVPVCKMPADFARGLAITGKDFVVADRHEDLLILFNSEGKRTGALEYPSYEPSSLTTDGKLLVVADRSNGRIYFLDPKTGECVRNIESPITPVVGLASNAKGQLWVAAGGAEELQLVDQFDGTTLASIKAPSSRLTSLAFDPDGYLWATDSSQDFIFMVDIRTGYTVFRLKSPGPVPNGLWRQGNDLYVSDYQTDTLYRADVSTLHGKTVRSDERRGHATLFSEVENLGPGKITGGTIVLAIPTNGSNQELDSLTVTEGGGREEDQWGQQIVKYELGELTPGQKKSVRLDGVGTFYEVSTKVFPHLVGELDQIPAEIREHYLMDADKYRSEGEFIQGKVTEIVGDEENPYFIARKLYDFLIGRINYQMIGGWDIAPTVIERGTGSCSEYTFAYVALCRAVGIPARYVGAMVLRGDDASVDTAFHRWAEIYLPKVGWIPVDVNAGDKQWQGERCFSFGGIANRFLITTRGGGDSSWLKWNYNHEVAYRTQGKANVRTEGFAEWDVIEEEVEP
jgi:sugar lactone lactonase YvrE